MAAFSKKYLYEETTAELQFENGIIFNAVSQKPVFMGWKNTENVLMGKPIDETDEDRNAQIFNNLQKGQTVNLSSVEVLSFKTTPSELHTEATLLTAMENAGQINEHGSGSNKNSIGKQAIRAQIISSLVEKKYIINKPIGKTNYILPTRHGISILQAVPSDLYNPQITADWEKKINEVICGKIVADDFLNDFYGFIKLRIDEMKNSPVKNIDFSSVINEFGKCLWCGADIYETQIIIKLSGEKTDIYNCSAKCGFSLRKDNAVYAARAGNHLTTNQVRELISEGHIIDVCVNKNGLKYMGKFTINKSPKGYACLDFSFAYKKTDKK